MVGIDAEGNPIVAVFLELVADGKPHPVTGIPAYDATAFTQVDAYTINFSRTKAGKVVQTGTGLLSQDGKTQTITTTGTDANGRQINNIAVYEKQQAEQDSVPLGDIIVFGALVSADCRLNLPRP